VRLGGRAGLSLSPTISTTRLDAWMRFVLTVVDPNRGVSADVVVDAEPGLTVAGLLPSLVEAVGRPVAVPGSARVINLHGPGASAD
jgi:DNA segregation ATPase FtsK/SpoIIIE, S-DNA-T family